jgi:chemotaxis protein histidine kinase CheA
MEKGMKNRVTEGLNNWQEKENQLKAIFGNDVTKEKHFLKGKMEFFNDLHKGIKGDANSNEKLLLNVIKGETNKLEKAVYPNLVARVFVKASDFVKEQVNAFKQRQQQMSKDLLSVSIVSAVPVTIKTQQPTAKSVGNSMEQSPKEQLEQQKKQTTILNVARDNKNILNESNSLLPKKRVSNSKGQHIH